MPRPRSEIGSVGLPLFSGSLALDTNTRLRGARGIKIYREMLLDEPAVAALHAAAMNLLRTDLQVVAGGKRASDARAAAFLETTLDDMRDAPQTYLRQLYGMLPYGYTVSELVWKRRNGGNTSKYADGMVGMAAWAYRRQDSFLRWETDKNGAITGWTQRPAPDYVERTIPLSKAIHVVADESEGSPEGKSAYRGMYVPYHFIKNLQLLYGISLERFGTGVPVFEIDEAVKTTLTDDQLTTLEDIAAGLRQNEEAYVITPAGIHFRFAESPGLNADSYHTAIQFFRVWALATGLADFIALGTGETGSFALGKDKSELFLLALNGYQDRLVSALNRQVVPRLFRYNTFGKLTDLPQFSLPAVRKYDLASLGTFAEVLNRIGAFHPTPEDEAWFRRISDLVDIDDKTLKQMHEADDAAAQDEPADTADMEGDMETGQDQGEMDEMMQGDSADA